jgi:S-formylglutathione hydrolase FrmB
MNQARFHLCLALTAIATTIAILPSTRAVEPDQADPLASDPQAAEITYKAARSPETIESHAIVVVPRDYERPVRKAHRYPVVYLLHGYSGNYRNWYDKTLAAGRPITDLADRHGIIIVMPDGQFASWYLNAVPDAPESEKWQWETAITKHLIPTIDRQYRTWAEPAARGIAGLSMGGHGALYLAARHPELFSVATGMSGVMDLTHTTQPHKVGQRLGPLEEHRDRWIEHSVITQAEKFAGHKVGILIDCGLEDVFFADHKALHAKLLELKIPHDYIVRPGGHTWSYWVNALPYHMQFFADRLKPAGSPDADNTDRPNRQPSGSSRAPLDQPLNPPSTPASPRSGGATPASAPV